MKWFNNSEWQQRRQRDIAFANMMDEANKANRARLGLPEKEEATQASTKECLILSAKFFGAFFLATWIVNYGPTEILIIPLGLFLFKFFGGIPNK